MSYSRYFLSPAFVVLLLTIQSVFAAPTNVTGLHSASSDLAKRQSITPLSKEEISAFKPFTLFAAAVYCPPSKTLTWSCGSHCKGNSDFQPIASGGDGGLVQFWYVGYDPSHDTVIVAHQGTNPFNPLADLTDLNLPMKPLDSDLFPGISSDILVHNGFALAHSRTASSILAAVKRTMSLHPTTTSVTIVGHSLGAAISLLDGVYLPLHLPQNISFRVIGYGLPRVGNKPFADYVDAQTAGGRLSQTHINKGRDPVTIVPWREIGYVHPSGEVHIKDNNDWVNCPGQDNASPECVVGAAPNLVESNLVDHIGPYDGTLLGLCQFTGGIL